jgi:acyl-CoA thioesterase YciA
VKTDIPSSIENRWIVSTKLVMPEHLNPAGSLFGGQMMSWMDKISAMLAQRIAKGNVVTVNVSEINFKAPGKSGDQIELNAYLKELGNSSVKVYVDAYRIAVHPDGTKKTLIADATFAFVHLGEDGKPKYIER